MTKEKTKIKGRPVIAIAAIIVVVLIIVIMIIFGRGKTTVTGQHPDDASDESLSCNKTGDLYPFFTYDKSLSKKTTITAIFRDGSVKSISMLHDMSYGSYNESIGSEAHNHAAMNKTFAKDGLGADSFSANYLRSDTNMRMSLFATKSDIENPVAYKYFLVDKFAKTIEDYKNSYEKQGFSCIIK